MKKENERPIGYLLKLLNITQSELAAAIYVDRSLISKWVSGAQPFGKGSKYYPAVLDFLRREVDHCQQERLQHFLMTYFRDQSVTTEEGLNRFLEETDIAVKKMEELCRETLNLQYVEAKISGDAKGRFQALISMLEQVLMRGNQKRQQLFLYDQEGFDWINGKKEWAAAFLDSVENILKQGHKLSMIFEANNKQSLKQCYMKKFFSYYQYNNFTEYYHCREFNENFSFSYYLWKDVEIIHSNLIQDGVYTLTLKDRGSLMSAERNVQLHIQNSTANSVIQGNSELVRLLHHLRAGAINNDTVYWYTPGLSVLTMSEELLQEVLHDNKVQHEKIQIVREFIAVYKKQLSSSPGEIRQFCLKEKIQNYIDQEKCSLTELNPFVGKTVYITGQQSKRHLKETLDFLKEQNKMKILFLKEEEIVLPADSGFVCKENHYFLLVYNKLRVIKEPAVFKNMLEILNHIWNKLESGGRDYEELENKI